MDSSNVSVQTALTDEYCGRSRPVIRRPAFGFSNNAAAFADIALKLVCREVRVKIGEIRPACAGKRQTEHPLQIHIQLMGRKRSQEVLIVYVSPFILGKKSEYFKNLFVTEMEGSSDMNGRPLKRKLPPGELEVEVPSERLGVELLHFIYNDRLDDCLNCEDLILLLFYGDRYTIPSLVAACANKLRQAHPAVYTHLYNGLQTPLTSLTVSRATVNALVEDLSHDIDLAACARRFTSVAAIMADTDAFLSLPFPVLLSWLREAFCRTTFTETRFCICLAWFRHNRDTLEDAEASWNSLIRCEALQFCQMDVQFLVEIGHTLPEMQSPRMRKALRERLGCRSFGSRAPTPSPAAAAKRLRLMINPCTEHIDRTAARRSGNLKIQKDGKLVSLWGVQWTLSEQDVLSILNNCQLAPQAARKTIYVRGYFFEARLQSVRLQLGAAAPASSAKTRAANSGCIQGISLSLHRLAPSSRRDGFVFSITSKPVALMVACSVRRAQLSTPYTSLQVDEQHTGKYEDVILLPEDEQPEGLILTQNVLSDSEDGSCEFPPILQDKGHLICVLVGLELRQFH